MLKGPQGTLYGRNATAGAVKVVSKEPSEEFGGSISTKIGNYDLRTVKLILDTPLIEDKLLMRSAFVRTKRDGYTKDILNGFDSDYEDLLSGRVTLKYLPSDKIDITLHSMFVNDDGDTVAWKHFVDPAGPFFGGGAVDIIK